MTTTKVTRLTALAVLCFLCLFVARPAYGQTLDAQIEQTALQELKQTSTPGVAIALVKDDRIIFSKALGFANLETQTTMTPDTLCRSGPISAVFTAAALLLLEEQGKLKLDQPVGRYINGLSPKLSAVNARQLLSHTAGLKEEHPTSGLFDDAALGRTVRSWNDDYSLSPPGQMYSHSNPGYVLAGLLLEEVSKEPFAQALNELLFAPLGMTRTAFRPSVVMTFPFAQSYRAFGREKLAQVRPFALDAFGWPSGSMFSNVNDLARFAVAFMNGGKIDGKQVLSSSAIAALSTPVAAVPGLNSQQSTYGFLSEDYRGVRVLSITGSWAGFTEQVWIVPEHRFAFIVMANRNMGYFNATAQKAMELMLPLGPAPSRTVTQVLPMSDEEMSSYLGTYSNEDNVELVLKDHQLFLRERGSEMPVTKLQEHVFAAGWPSPQAQVFTLLPGAGGRIEFLHRFGRALKRIPASQTRNQ